MGLFSAKPLSGNTKFATVKDVMDLPAFNAMYAVEEAGVNCKDPLLGLAFQKQIVHDAIRAGGKNIDLNFFFDMFGQKTINIETTRIFNRYLTDLDHNIYIEATAKGTAAGGAFTATILRENHSGNGKYSYPAKYYSLLDKDNGVWYSIEDVDTTTDYAHVMTLKPFDGTVTGELKPNTKYMVIPARFIGGDSTPHDTNAAVSAGYAQEVRPFRIRRDWAIKVRMLRGYADKLRFTLMWDTNGNKVDAWDAYEAQKAREDLRMALNVIAFIGTPITNADLISGAGATSVDDTHTGFNGLLPSLEFGGGKVVDFDPAVGFDLDSNLEPFILQQDTLKKTSRFLVRHGKSFKAGLNRRANRMVKYEGLGLNEWPAFQRNGEKITKLETSAYEYLGYIWDFSEWGALNDTRFIGTKKFDNMGIALALDGITDANTGAALPALEFYKYGAKETGDYEEYTTDQRSITRTEEINGWCADTIMMALHCPGEHLMFNPTH